MSDLDTPDSPADAQAVPDAPGEVMAPDDPWAADPVLGREASNPIRLVLLIVGIGALGVFFGFPLLAVVLALILSIWLHEMGHFLVARRNGMQCTEFFIGMGPRIWSFSRNGVEYGVKAVPVGAYVRIVGMHNLEDVDPTDEVRTYRSKTYLRRLSVVLAGPAMNLLIGIVLMFGVIAVSGREVDTAWTVGAIVPGSGAEQAGLQTGDKVLSVDGVPIDTWEQFGGVIDERAGEQVSVVVARDGQELTLDATFGWDLNAEAAAAIPSNPALPEGTRVISLDGVSVAVYDDLVAAFAAGSGTSELVVESGFNQYRLPVELPLVLPDSGDAGFFGLGVEAGSERYGVLAAAGATLDQTRDIFTGFIGGLGRLFSPTGLSNYASFVVDSTANGSAASTGEGPALVPVDADVKAPAPTQPEERPISIFGIVSLGSQVYEQAGLAAMLWLLATVNIFLALINLLPLLPFDGGHAAVATYEAIRERIGRRPYRVNMARLMPATYAVLFLLLFVGLSSILVDVRNPIQLP